MTPSELAAVERYKQRSIDGLLAENERLRRVAEEENSHGFTEAGRHIRKEAHVFARAATLISELPIE